MSTFVSMYLSCIFFTLFSSFSYPPALFFSGIKRGSLRCFVLALLDKNIAIYGLNLVQELSLGSDPLAKVTPFLLTVEIRSGIPVLLKLFLP